MNDVLKERFDVIIVGAGIGGLIAGALLAKGEKKRVLVLEKETEIGGRGMSWRGDDTDYKTMNRLRLNATKTRVIRSYPSAEEIQEKNLMTGYVLEAGLHGIPPWMRHKAVFEYLGLPFFSFANDYAEYFNKGKKYRLLRSEKPGWLTDSEWAEIRNINKEQVLMRMEECEELDHVSFKEWLSTRTSSENVIEFQTVLAALNMTINDIGRISAGDLIKMNRQTMRSRCHFSEGGIGTLPDPGFNIMAYRLRDFIKHAGGAVVTDATVRRIDVANGAVNKVHVAVGDQEHELTASTVFFNIPIQECFKIIDRKHFPEDVVERVSNFEPAASFVAEWGLKKPLVKGPVHVPALCKAEEGFAGDVFFCMWSPSAWAPSRAPLAEQSLEAYTPLTAEEAKDRAKVKKVIERTEEFMDTHYPEFRKNLIWGEYLVSDVLVGVAQTPDQVFDAKIENKCPWIDGLYFVGDTAKCWGAASDSAVHSALRAVSQFTEKNYLEILPEYQR